jgi:uncharacterized protein YdaU (DUF1376 family)
MSDHWHKHYHSRILNSYATLPIDLRGVAYTLLDLIYDAGGPIADSDAILAARMCCSLRKWKSYKEQLLQLGKFEMTGEGRITNSLCEHELFKRRKQAEFGSAGGRAKAENGKTRNQFKGGDVGTLQGTLLANQKVEIEKKDSEPKGSDAGASEPLSIKSQIWAVGRPMFEKAGTSKAAAGAVIGKLIKTKGEVEALSVITALRANPPMDPEEYLWAVIHGKQALATDVGAAPQLELVMVDGKPTMQPISRRVA